MANTNSAIQTTISAIVTLVDVSCDLYEFGQRSGRVFNQYVYIPAFYTVIYAIAFYRTCVKMNDRHGYIQAFQEFDAEFTAIVKERVKDLVELVTPAVVAFATYDFETPANKVAEYIQEFIANPTIIFPSFVTLAVDNAVAQK